MQTIANAIICIIAFWDLPWKGSGFGGNPASTTANPNEPALPAEGVTKVGQMIK
jgi:hypothetical protein